MSGTDVGNDEADEGGSSARYAHKYSVVVGTVLSPSPSSSSSSLLLPPLSSHHRRRLRAVDPLRPHDRSDLATPGGVAAASCDATIHSGSDRIPSKPLRSSSVERSKQQQPSKAAGSVASSSSAASSSSSAGSARWCGRHDRFSNSGQHSAKDGDGEKGKVGGTPASSPAIEVAPGIQLRLRGSQETWEAISRDYYVPGLCWGCSETIFVIQDAAYVLCPACRTVSPMDGTFEQPEVSGVGLGFTFDELVMWQQQIADERSRGLCN
jgi:hypothetical protein